MLELVVVKIGLESFDALHAYGLAVLIAEMLGTSVIVRDCGLTYRLSASCLLESARVLKNVSEILVLPTNPDFFKATELELANFDGLSAASFTSPGIRLVSTRDAIAKQRFDQDVTMAGLDKVRRLRDRLTRVVNRTDPCHFLECILRTYDARDPKIPHLHRKGAFDIGVNMPLDPAFAYSTRGPFSDGSISDKMNVAVNGTPHAAVLACLGAARCLRAQRVGGGQINIYVPLFNKLSVESGFRLPLLSNVEYPMRQAALVQWLSLYCVHDSNLAALSYQTLQTQGAKQSFSLDRGHLSFSRLCLLDANGFAPLIDRWLDYLTTPAKFCSLDQELLCNALLVDNVAAWLTHLGDVAQVVNARSEKEVYAYQTSEVFAMIDSQNSKESALSTVLQSDQGTLRFGYSLRSLGEHRRGDLRDSLYEIETAHTRDQLLLVLARSTQKCVLAKATSNFVIVPNDIDLGFLLDDVDRWGVRDIASLLIILASLRYPQRASGMDQTASDESIACDYSI